MKKAVVDIIKKLSQTAAGKKMTPKQLEARAKMDYKDAQDYKAKIDRESKSFMNQVDREVEAKANLKDPNNRAMLNAKEREMEKYAPGYKGKTYKKGGKVGMGMTKNNYKKGGKVSSCSKRADGCTVKGKTKGRMI